MGDLSTYSLSDFFPFTPDVYFRLFERQNEALWPAQILAVLLGIAAVWLAWKGRGKLVGFIVGAAWAFVGYTFHLELYANLNWAAEYFGWFFIAQGILAAVLGLLGDFDRQPEEPFAGPQWAGLAIATFGLIFFPLIAPLAGRSWTGAELFGVAPDPTVIVTLGLVSMARRVGWPLLLIAFFWALISGATAWEMGAVAGLTTPVVAVIALGCAVWKARLRRR